MKITLIRTGGLIPLTKKAEQEVEWTNDELHALLQQIKTSDEPGQARDKSGYIINSEAGSFPVDLEKIPASYKDTFEELKNKLTIVKK